MRLPMSTRAGALRRAPGLAVGPVALARGAAALDSHAGPAEWTAPVVLSVTEGLESTLALEESEGSLWLRVADDGAGVPVEIRERIFDPFFSTRGPGQGTGLGLFISRQLLRGNGGDLRLVSSGEGGATLEVRLPLEGRDPAGRVGA